MNWMRFVALGIAAVVAALWVTVLLGRLDADASPWWFVLILVSGAGMFAAISVLAELLGRVGRQHSG